MSISRNRVVSPTVAGGEPTGGALRTRKPAGPRSGRGATGISTMLSMTTPGWPGRHNRVRHCGWRDDRLVAHVRGHPDVRDRRHRGGLLRWHARPDDRDQPVRGHVGPGRRLRFRRDESAREHTESVAITGDMRPLASDFNARGPVLGVDHMTLSPYATTGTFLSRIHDASSPADWGSLAYDADIPDGTTLALEVRTGESAVLDDSWTQFAPVAQGADIPTDGRYLQYRVSLSTSDVGVTPVLLSVNLPNTPGVTPACPVGEFRAEYFANTDLSGDPVVVRCEPQIETGGVRVAQGCRCRLTCSRCGGLVRSSSRTMIIGSRRFPTTGSGCRLMASC